MYRRLVTFVLATMKMAAADRSIPRAVRAVKARGVARWLSYNPLRMTLVNEEQSAFWLDATSDTTLLHLTAGDPFRAIFNTDKTPRQSASERASVAEIDAVFNVDCAAKSSFKGVGERSENDLLLLVLSELPEDVRQALEAALFRNAPYSEIAEERGISKQLVERDIQQALEHCARRVRFMLTPSCKSASTSKADSLRVQMI